MLRQGTLLGGRYEILSQIGSGGMSEVYKAKDHKLNREVALKVLKKEFNSDQSFVSKFRMEAQNAARLSHPNIVSVYDVGEDQGVYYIVMELIKGITLKKYIERKKKLEIRESIEVAMQVARGLEAAHSQHIVHRDIKPQNIMISMEGKVKVTDFGIAHAVSSQTISSNSMGSVHYISPEQARGGYCDEKSDIYSLGITFYEMLTGRVPFDGDSTVAVALLHIQGEMVPPRQYEPLIPVSLEKIILKCTQKKPDMRYASATELIEDLKKALTMPNEDFVRMPGISNGQTTVITDNDMKEIRRRKNEGTYSDSYDDYGVDDYDDYDDRRRYDDDDYDDDDLYGDDDDYRGVSSRKKKRRSHSGAEKAVTGIALVVAFIIIIFAVVLLLKGCGMGADSGSSAASESSLSGEQVQMVNLLGMTRDEAVAKLDSMGLTYRIDTGNSDDYPEGQVFEQQYKEGEMLAAGTEVLIRISVGTGKVTIPDNLAGMSVETATSTLSTAGITVAATQKEDSSDTVEAGKVMGTDPAMGTEIDKGTVVTLIISTGAAKIQVPSLLNMSEEKAVSTLEAQGLKAGTITYQESSDVAEGNVVSQSVTAGTEVTSDTTVDLVISKGSSRVTVPNVTGKSLSSARSALASAGLTVGTVTEKTSSSVSKGNVISQSVSAGSSVKKGASVNLVVSKGAGSSSNSATSATKATTAAAPTSSPTEPAQTDPTPAFNEGDDSGDPDEDAE